MVSYYPGRLERVLHATQAYVQRHSAANIVLVFLLVIGLLSIMIISWLYLSENTATREGDLQLNSSTKPEAVGVRIVDKPVIFSQDETNDTLASRSQQSSTGDDSSGSSVVRSSLTVNGEPIQVKKNSSVHKTIRTDDGKTTVNISVDSRSSNSSDSSLNIDLHSTSESTRVNN